MVDSVTSFYVKKYGTPSREKLLKAQGYMHLNIVPENPPVEVIESTSSADVV